VADETRCCTACRRDLPAAAFNKDARLKAGVRAVCKSCDRAAVAKRRRGDNPKPGALVLVPNFPTPPSFPSADEPAVRLAAPGGAALGTFSAAAEAFVNALSPAAGPADALLVRSLRGLAELADVYSHGPEVVKDTNALVTSMLRVQRELAATRASKAQAAPAEQPSRPSAASYRR
jgi:hypothetical protein